MEWMDDICVGIGRRRRKRKRKFVIDDQNEQNNYRHY
jgi:hypothetical protein